MNNLIVQLRNFSFNIVSSLLSVLRIVLFSSITINKYRKHSKSRPNLLIIANGPSVSHDEENILRLKDKMDCLMVNLAPLSWLFTQIQPKFLLIAAPELFMQDVDEEYIAKSDELFSALTSKTTWNLSLIVPISSKKSSHWLKTVKKNQNIRVHYFNNTGAEGLKSFTHLLFNLELAVPRPHNVVIPSLMIGIWMRYEGIFLVGVDHSWLPEVSVDDGNNVLIHQKHYYDQGQTKPKHMAHLGRGQRKLHEVLRKFMLTFEGYHQIESYSSSRSVSIINLTKNSFIDAFQRMTFDDLNKTSMKPSTSNN